MIKRQHVVKHFKNEAIHGPLLSLSDTESSFPLLGKCDAEI